MAGETRQMAGLDDLKAKLSEIPKVLRRRLLRNWLAAGGRVVRDEAKRNAPVLAASSRTAPYRKPGTVRDAISVRTSKLSRRRGDVGVFVNVKPAKSGQRGAKSPNDPYYWRWLEFGSKFARAFGFLRAGAGKLPMALQAFERSAGKWFTKINAQGKVTE